jgi:flavin reductase (DIM6/NTAB) family NADH-FMN oxidoreductase RutF
MRRKEIKISDFKLNPIDIFKKGWLLLTAGNMDKYNMMTIGWGSIGTMWNKPFVQVVVRPSRYTYQFMNEFSTFTLTSFSKEYKKDLTLLGTKSGYDCDKLSETPLTSMKSKIVEAPSYEEAEMVIECKTIYIQEMDKDKFLVPEIEKNYNGKDYHRIYFGEILHIEGN